MPRTKCIKQDSKTDNKSENTYRIRINDTDVRIRFSGESSINARLASAFGAMLK